MTWEKFVSNVLLYNLPFFLNKLLGCLFYLFSYVMLSYVNLSIFETFQEFSWTEFVLRFYKVPILDKMA